MSNKKLDQLIDQMENYLECWKQFNQFLAVARAKKFSPDDDIQFLEIKSVLVQELELIMSAIEVGSPTKEEIHALVGNAPRCVTSASRAKERCATSKTNGIKFISAGMPSLAS